MLTFIKEILTWWNRQTLGTRINTILFVGNNKLEALIKSKKCCDYFSNAWKDNLKTILN